MPNRMALILSLFGCDIESDYCENWFEYFETNLDQGRRGSAGGGVVEVQEFHRILVSEHLRLPLLHMIRMMKVVAEKTKKKSNLI